MKALILSAILLNFSSLTCADDINSRTGLPPEAQSKINEQIAKAYLQGQSTLSQTTNIIDNAQSDDGSVSQSSGSTQMINTFTNVRQAPREVITYSPDGIYNICFHCR